MISKDGRPIRTLDEWREFAGPKSANQWKDGRSAKEAARAWLGDDPSTLPAEILTVLSSHTDFGLPRKWTAEPEVRVRFDSFPGEPPNIDMLVKLEDVDGSAVLVVEAKADETFAKTLERTLAAASARLESNPRSNGVERLKNLARLVLGVDPGALGTIGHIRYQLLTATAAALFEARRDGVTRALVLVEEFVTDQTDDRKHAANAIDLNAFVELLGGGEVSSGTIQGPFHFDGVLLYVGKVVHHLRGQGA